MFTKLAKAIPLLQPSIHNPAQCLLQQQRYKALRQFLHNARQQRRPATTIAQYTRYLPQTQQTCKSTKQLLQTLQRQRRHASNGARYGTYPPGTSVWTKASDLWSEYPFSVTIALIVITGSTAIIIYQLYYYQTFVIGAFHTFPEEVAKPLRKAIYYTNIDLNPPWALRYYKEAISKAMELRMDPGSDEFLGIYIQLAAMFEKANHFQKSIEVLERIRTDCMGWLDRNGTKPGNEAKRTRLLGKTVQLSVKLGELYSGQHVLDLAMAEAHLVYAVETALKEQIRREKEGIKPDEGDWMTAEELGGNFETLGHHYEAKNQFHLAGPLFLQALNQCPPTSCHAAVLMNNLATCVAQQNPPTEATRHQATPSRSSLVDNAISWTQKALELTANIKPPERTEECDVACATATHNLGEFAEMNGNIREARIRYDEAKALAKAIKYNEGIVQADAALARLTNSKV